VQTFKCDALHDSPPPPAEGAPLPLNLGAPGGNRARAVMGQGKHVFHGALQFGVKVSATSKSTGIAEKIKRA